MPNSSPPWVRTVEVAVVVDSTITPAETSFDEVIAKLDELWVAFLADPGADIATILSTIIANWAAFLAGPGVDIADILTTIADNWTEFKTTTGAKVDDIFDELDANWDEAKELWFPTNKRAAGGVGKYSGTDTTYQSVVSWTVASGWEGELKEILILADDYAHTLIQITVGAVTWCTDWNPQGAMPIVFEDLRLAAGQVVSVEAKSDDGTAIVVDAIIVAKEIG